VSTESIPKSKAEVVLSRFQDAANASAAAGRSFVSLCSLVDLHLTGKLTREELLHTAKMMDCPLTAYDLEAMLELLPHGAVGSDDKIDYRLLHTVLQTFTPRQTRDYDIEPQLAAGHGARTGALPAYASPGRLGSTSHLSFNFPQGLHASYNEVSTPLGNKVQTPYGHIDDPLSATLRPGSGVFDVRGSAPASSGAYERILRLIVERVKAAIEERTRLWGPTYNLRGHLEYFDSDQSGTVPTRSFQQVMHELGVQLSPSDLQTLYGLYGRPEDSHIFYDAFLRAVDGNTSTAYPPPLPAHMQASVAHRRSISLPQPPTLGNNRAPGGAAYVHPRVLQRYRELKQEGNDPRDFFAVHDIDRAGMVSPTLPGSALMAPFLITPVLPSPQIPQGKFASVISKLQLLQTDHQLSRAVDDFTSLSNRALVLYEDFLDALERAANAEGRLSLSASMHKSTSGGFVNGSGYDGLRGSVSANDGWEDELRRFRQGNTPRQGDYPIELEEGSIGLSLSPPKVADSLSFSRVGGLRGNHSPGRYHRSEDVSPRSSYQRSIAHPSTSPSKVGSKMWGSHTPLAKKGNVLNAGDGNWCCAVCLYVENPLSAQTCAVCDSPNYTIRKVQLALFGLQVVMYWSYKFA
jgi:Ca2+-binding EF-hand superfamily protein